MPARTASSEWHVNELLLRQPEQFASHTVVVADMAQRAQCSHDPGRELFDFGFRFLQGTQEFVRRNRPAGDGGVRLVKVAQDQPRCVEAD
jgi:hypothetical protein